MSRQVALDTINLKAVPYLAHTDYSVEYHTEYIKKKIGMDLSELGAKQRLYDFWSMDFLFYDNDGLHGNWERYGRITDMGHAKYAADASDKRLPKMCPFETVEEVWDFDAVAEYGLPDFDEQVAAYEQIVQNDRQNHPEQLVTGGYYKSIVSGAIQTFGWEMLLIGASDRAKMEKVFDSFFRLTLFHMEAWAKTNIEVIIQHDDFVWTSGPFMKPDYYKQVIIPRYGELWKPLHDAGKKVLFCSDGNFMEFAEDIVAAGADGLIFEPCNDFGFMAERFGQTTVLVGSYVDCRDMTFGEWDKVQADMDRTFETAKRCKSVIFAVGNHLPANIPDDMMDRYIEYFKVHRLRPSHTGYQ